MKDVQGIIAEDPSTKNIKFFKNRKLSHSRKKPGEKETLYEESMKLKIFNNNLKEDNHRLKTQIQVIENELEKRDHVKVGFKKNRVHVMPKM